jgi:hypothetical protein
VSAAYLLCSSIPTVERVARAIQSMIAPRRLCKAVLYGICHTDVAPRRGSSGMAAEHKRAAKTEVLSIRMDPKTRFVLDFIARMRGQSITTVVERSLQETADRNPINETDSRGNSYEKTWRDYWHINEGIRWLMIASDPNLYSTFDEEYKVAFTKTHWPFFYNCSSRDSYKEWAIEVIWPRIDEFVDIWTRTKSTDYFAAGNAMQEAIKQAGLRAPEWPIKPPEKPVERQKTKVNDLDDDIPF